jgi:hypothetical protein
MPILKVYDDTSGRGTCRSCGASITWYELTSGKRHPFDGEPTYVRTAQADGRLVGEIDTSFCTSHFATCPDAKDWRRRK